MGEIKRKVCLGLNRPKRSYQTCKKAMVHRIPQTNRLLQRQRTPSTAKYCFMNTNSPPRTAAKRLLTPGSSHKNTRKRHNLGYSCSKKRLDLGSDSSTKKQAFDNFEGNGIILLNIYYYIIVYVYILIISLMDAIVRMSFAELSLYLPGNL